MHDTRANNPTGHPFTDAELEALRSFRAAIAAGLYGNRELDAPAPDCDESRLSPDSAAPTSIAYPFTREELARLGAYKRAVAAGFYRDGGTPNACFDRRGES